ncbi:MAG: response regulator transcription factor [Actinomycetota bacterium]
MTKRVLVVDDDPIVRDVLVRYLRRDGFEVDTAADGEAALGAIADGAPDLVVLDLMLPKLDGFGVFERMRDFSNAPVIMLTAKGDETDRIAGLEWGADDYVNKPFSPKEVCLRVQAVLRRTPGGEAGSGRRLTFDGLEIDTAGRQVFVEGREVTMTPKEFDVLTFLARNPGRAFGRLDLLGELWDFAYSGDPSTVTVHIRRIREKIEEDPSAPRHLVTVWGAGYRFDP